MAKRNHEEQVLSPNKCSRVDSPLVSRIESTEGLVYIDETTSFPDTCCEPTKDILNEFFIDFNFAKPSTPTTSHELIQESLQEPIQEPPQESTAHASNDDSFVFWKELGNSIFLGFELQNSDYSIHIREFTCEGIPTQNGITMDIQTWYEFQYKIVAFNLRYKSSSFVSNNKMLVLNEDNSVMCLKSLTNDSHIKLNNYQLEQLKEKAYKLNKKLIHHQYEKHLPNLLKKKCKQATMTQENEFVLWSKLIFYIENNIISIFNEIYQCTGCVFRHPSVSLHSCFTFNNREKFKQVGDMILMLVNFDDVLSMFLKKVDFVSDHFLCNLNVQTFKSVLFE